MDFTNDHSLAYVSQRRLGRVDLTNDLEDFAKEQELGPDALDSGFDLDDYRRVLTRGGGSIKSALMNQKRIAGIGNIYADEILFQSRIHPDKRASEVTDSQLKALSKAIPEVLKTAIERGADPSRFPANYLLPQRETGSTCPVCGGKVKEIKISGRTAYFCPKCQSD